LYFVVSRQSQKFANIQKDNRVSLVVGRDFHDPATIKALSIAAHASEVTDVKQRERAVALLLERHPGLRKLEPPEPAHSVVMRAYPAIVTILDYSKGFGHADVLTVSPGGVEMTPARDDHRCAHAATTAVLFFAKALLAWRRHIHFRVRNAVEQFG
jgi:hypothetical protein